MNKSENKKPVVKTVSSFIKMKQENQKISMVTCYDATYARIISQSNTDMILVGDSLAMVIYGYDSTLPATNEMMAVHIAAVRRGAPDAFIVGDMPFLSVRKGLEPAMDSVGQLMQSGANAVKIEGIDGHGDIIKHIAESGVPVMGHLGLTPQSVHALNGFKVQGKTEDGADTILRQAKELEELGCFSIVLECVPASLCRRISKVLTIPTIGIGSGVDADGQVLVMQDILGLNKGFKPKFVRYFQNGEEDAIGAFDSFNKAVKEGSYPTIEESFK